MKQSFCYLYYVYFNQPLPPEDFQVLVGTIPPVMQQKALSFKRWEDAHAYVLGRKLLQQVLTLSSNGYGLSDISYNAYGRPAVDGFADFNISHSGNLVVCMVIGGGRIGIDIEQRKPLDISDFVNHFSVTEWEMIRRSDSPLDLFYEYWTAKEALLKADGRGLNENLANIDVSGFDKVAVNDDTWQLYRIDHFKDYACHIACSGSNLEFILTDMTGRFYSGQAFR